MSLLNPAILWGLGLATIPVVLHFLLKSKPKKLLFPALRFLAMRRQHNARRMRLKHLWLLLLRIAVIALIVIAISRPSLPAANYNFVWSEWLTLAGIGAVAAGVYWGLLRYWRKQSIPQHQLAYRRSILRGSTGAGVFVLFLLLVAWPYAGRVRGEIAAPLPNVAENIPVAAVMLFDTSLSMAYQQEGATRLERAAELATDHLGTLPPGSRIAITDTARDDPILFQADRGSAGRRVGDLEPEPGARPINDRLVAALRLQQEDLERTLEERGGQDGYLREIYVFTDFAGTAWRQGAANRVKDLLAELETVRVYVVDVGVDVPTNTAITDLRLSKQTLGRGAELFVNATIESAKITDDSPVAEIHVQDETGAMVKQGQQSLDFSEDRRQTAQFLVRGLHAPVAHGYVKLVASDPLRPDDTRYFTVRVVDPPKVLLVGPDPTDMVFLEAALAPPALVEENRSQYLTDYLPPSELLRTDLTPYESIVLVNVESLTEDGWSKLKDFVSAGGGLAVVLGSKAIDPLGYEGDAANELLPAAPLGDVVARPPAVVDLTNLDHPILQRFEDVGTELLSNVDVQQIWRVQPRPGATVVSTFTDSRRSPAIVEWTVDKGRVVMLTTAVDLPARDDEGRLVEREWSHLPFAKWQFVVFIDQTMRFLGRRGSDVFSFQAGDEVILPLPDPHPLRYVLRMPEFEQRPGSIPPEVDRLVVRDATTLGRYDVESSDDQLPLALGFSVNPRSAESNLDRLDESALDGLLGEGRYALAREVDSLERVVLRGRVGQEVFPIVLAIVILVFCTEHLVANRFYESDQAVEHA